MKTILCQKRICKKLIVYMSASFLFASAMPPVHAAETAQPSGTQTENAPSNNTQTDTVTSDNTQTDTVTPDNTQTNTAPSDNTPVQTPPADGTDMPAGTDGTNPPAQQNPDDVVITPQPDIPASDANSVGTPGITPIQATIYVSAGGGVNVRSGPSTNDSILGKLKYGTALTAIGQTSDNWYQVQYAGGTGYVRADTVTDTPVTVETPGTPPPAAEAPATETPDTQAPATQSPDDGNLVPEEPAAEETSEEETGEAAAAETTRLFGTPVIVVLVLAIIGVLALITFSVISLFKKENVTDGYYDDAVSESDGYFEENNEYLEQDDEYFGQDDEYFEACYYEDGDEKE